MTGYEDIKDFLKAKDSGLQLVGLGDDQVLTQSMDEKSLKLRPHLIEDVLKRSDSDGNSFLQLNFVDGTKVLLTKHLVGFKPSIPSDYGLEEGRLPKVVTTPDLLSIIDVVADNESFDPMEIDILRRVYMSILDGGETIGFDLSRERQWLSQFHNFSAKA